MLDVLGLGLGVLFFVGCEFYIHYCDRLLTKSQSKGGGVR